MGVKRRRAPRRQRPARWRRVVGSIAATALCLGLLTLGTLWSLRGGALAAMTDLRPPFGGRERVNILVLGIDDGQGGVGRSDTLLLARVDTKARRVTALSIPRDTRVPLGDGRFGKINSAHARGGPALAAHVVSELTGLPVDYTLRTDFSGFSHMVDLLGGIDMNVEQAMDYDDHWAGLNIHLKPGPQHLDGARAIQYVRFRKSNAHRGASDGSDISRIARQQKFLEATVARCLSGANLLRLPEIVREGRRQLQTDLSPGDLLYLSGLAKEIGASRLNVSTVPGKTATIDGQSYWLPDSSRMAAVVQQMADGHEPKAAPVTVAVLNGSHLPGLARRVAVRLQRQGYQVATIATSPTDAVRSEVIAAEPSGASARTIASLLKCGCSIGAVPPAEAKNAQVTVVLGRDCFTGRGGHHRG